MDPTRRKRDGSVVLRLVKNPDTQDIGTSRPSDRQEPEALVAVLSLGAIAIITLVSLLMKLLGLY